MIPFTQNGEGAEPASAPRSSVAPDSGWVRRVHRQLGLALVPWMIVGGVAVIGLNHTRGFAAPFDESSATTGEAEPAARRAWGHLMAKASLAGELVDLVPGSAEWIEAAESVLQPDHEVDSRPAWARAERLEGFELPEVDRPDDARALLSFLVRSEGRLWRCTVELDGSMSAIPVDASDAEEMHGALEPGTDGPWAVFVDLVAVAMLLWGTSACVVFWSNPTGRRSGLIALAAGAGALAAFVTTI